MPERGTKTRQRQRRTGKEVVERLRGAARQLFAERGFAATTTREIAKLAEVNESLLFRHFGDKEGLFDEVISAPFNQLIDGFAARQKELTNEESRIFDRRNLVGQIIKLFQENRELFIGVLATPQSQAGTTSQVRLGGLERYFNEAAHQVELSFLADGQKPPLNLDIAARLCFGIIASSVLLRDWLFPLGAPPEQVIAETIQEMIRRALSPAGKG